MRNVSSSVYRHFLKRFLDIVLSIVALPLFAIILLVLAPFIYFEDKGPIFYNAPRMGRAFKPFKMYKFRTMKVDSPDLKMPDGSTYNSPLDPRLTRIGRFMRKTSLDEVPQLLNVLGGTMSLIGPRPDLKEEVDLYEGGEGRKLEVLPGITGYAAVYGRNAIPWKERLKLDVYYVEHLSFVLDLKIFFKTFAVIFKQEGVYVEAEDDVAPITPDEGD
jgi:undecaprenyl phosphate N,N'-diacetylbacillosamine 1-phosphate transferase